MFFQSDCVELKECLACGSTELNLILDLNSQPLANSYKTTKAEKQDSYPLAINHCESCHHVQLTHAVNPDLMFKDYLYVSGTSKTMNEHFEWFAQYAYEYFENINQFKPISVFDIGCNDGSQLDQFKKFGIRTIGIDPAENLHDKSSKNHKTYLGYFDKSFLDFRKEVNYDIVLAQNVFAHNYDPLAFLESAREVMLSTSILFVQTSQADMILNNEFDTIYHEHISFYNINSMNEVCKRAGLHLIDVIKCPLHGNSYIFVISKQDKRPANVKNLIDMEIKAGLFRNETYKIYADNCKKVAVDFKDSIETMRKAGFTIVGYGAAAKGMTLLNYTNVDMHYIVDDNPLKQNLYTPGSNIPIVSSSEILKSDNNTRILFVPLAWNFFEEIRNRIKSVRDNENDCFLKYFPNVKVI